MMPEVLETTLPFSQSKTRFETWLSKKLEADLVASDLAQKNELLRESPFVFLRGTYWRWAETILHVCPELANAPQVLAVGDIHLENFGTWRDADGRLVWGVNDFDEAAEMPYVIDLVRLATSIALAEDTRRGLLADACAAILKGYTAGLDDPRPIILDGEWQWLREMVVVPEDRRQKFWKNIDARVHEKSPPHFRDALAKAMPSGVAEFDTARRIAGTGSLGRPRWVAVADWQGGPVIREAKSVLTSAWSLAHENGDAPSRCAEAAGGRFRAQDPWYSLTNNIVVRRLSPNNRKVEVEKRAGFLLSRDMHEVMGRELANVHLGASANAGKILDDLSRRKRKWLINAAEHAAQSVTDDYRVCKKI
jgi:uncharacterized protein (DUF2252 family)